jgi:glutamate:GABA antiporter
MMTVGTVGYLGSAPATSVFGLPSVFLYVLPAVVFLVPVSLVAAELASGWQGGVYNWVCEGISAPFGLLAVWCQFSQTIFYYPALLGYVGSTLAYVIDPHLASNGVFTAATIIVLFWGGVLVCSRGVPLVARLSSSGTVIGTLVPGAILVVLGVAYLIQGNRSAAPMNVHHVLPPWHGLASIVLVVNSFFTYAGIEVTAVHVDELRSPGREYPRAILLAMVLVLAVFILPTLAIAWVIPSAQISLTAGVMQAFNSLFTHFDVSFAVPLIAVALAAGALAGMLAWLDGPSEGLLRIGREHGYLPPYFQKVNDHGVEVRILAAQGAVITIIALLYAFIPTISRAYWIFTAIGSQGRGAVEARFPVPLSIRACGFPAHGLPMIFLMVTTLPPGSGWCRAGGRGHAPQTTRASRRPSARGAGCDHNACASGHAIATRHTSRSGRT